MKKIIRKKIGQKMQRNNCKRKRGKKLEKIVKSSKKFRAKARVSQGIKGAKKFRERTGQKKLEKK